MMMTIQQAFELALQHHQAGRLAEAEMLYRKILAVPPVRAEALHLLGVVAHQTGRHEEAIRCIQESTAHAPHNARAHANLGEVYAALGNYAEAIRCHRQAIQLKPEFPAAHYNLGNALQYNGQLDEAIASYRQALALQPQFPKALSNLGVAQFDSGDLDGAITTYRQALQLNPDNAGTHSNLIYALTFHPSGGPALQEEQRCWNERFARPLEKFPPVPRGTNAERRLRIGYISPDFRDHVTGRYLLPLFQYHDRERFEIICFSDAARPDALTDRIRALVDEWEDTGLLDDAALAALVREKKIDVFADLTQHMAGNRLRVFARQPAPVQVSFAGYPESTGVEGIGYRISDRWLEGEERKMANGKWQNAPEPGERVYLLDSFWCYDPCGVEMPVNALPARMSGIVTFGSLNNFCKVNEPLLRLWARVLGAVKASRLMLLSPRGSHRQRTRDFLERAGVAPTRVEFVEPCPRREYLELYHQLDVVLDTFPYNGHTTSMDALWMGVPVVSLAGEPAVSRAGWSQLSNLGLPELVAHSEDEFVEIASRLAGDFERLAKLRASLRGRMETSVLMDGGRFARQIEEAYRAMWQQWCEAGPAAR